MDYGTACSRNDPSEQVLAFYPRYPAQAAFVHFDDSQWQPVGLPHSFSLPYFMSKDFYTGMVGIVVILKWIGVI